MLTGLISIGIFLAIQLVTTVWWASAINTKMDFVINSTAGLRKNLDEHVSHDLNTFSTKHEVSQALTAHEKEVAVALGFANKEVSAMWKRIDTLGLKQGG